MILVLRALGVGDLATAVPALRGLRAVAGGQRLVLAAPGWLAPLAELIGGVDRVLPTEDLTGRNWPRSTPRLAVNLHGRGPQSHLLMRAADPARLLAFRCPEAGHLDGPAWDDDEHEVDRWCRLLGWYGIACDPMDLALVRPAPGLVPQGATVIHPGTKVAEKRWPAERFAGVAAALHRRGHRVVITGSREERELAAWVALAAGLPATSVLAGRTDVAELAGLVAYARLLVSVDTGVAHLATAYGTPSVVLFGPVSPRHWGPPPDRPWHRVIPLTVSDCLQDGRASNCAIGVDEVLAAVDEVERMVREPGAVATQ